MGNWGPIFEILAGGPEILSYATGVLRPIKSLRLANIPVRRSILSKPKNFVFILFLIIIIIIIIIIIMNFYSPVSNTRCHSIGHKMRIARIKIRVDSPGRWERA